MLVSVPGLCHVFRLCLLQARGASIFVFIACASKISPVRLRVSASNPQYVVAYVLRRRPAPLVFSSHRGGTPVPHPLGVLLPLCSVPWSILRRAPASPV